MQRTLNYTEEKINRDEATFSISYKNTIPEFKVEFNLDKKNITPDARVYVDAHNNITRQRFDFGEIQNITPPISTVLDEVDLSTPTLFDIFIVDKEKGKVLARGDRFRTDHETDDGENKSSILTITSHNLGQTIWKISYDQGEMPELLINENIPNLKEKLIEDPLYTGLILPAALKEILFFILFDDPDQDSERSQKWISYAETLLDKKKPDSDDPLELSQWANEVVDEFCQINKFRDNINGKES